VSPTAPDDAGIGEPRRDLAEDLAAQWAEAARNLTVLSRAILAARGGE
jgi:hypothetical protein